MILESKRGGERQDFDFPALEKHRVLDITGYVRLHFSAALARVVNNRFESKYSSAVTEDSKFFTLDRRLPAELIPDVAKCMRDSILSTELKGFIVEVVNVQVRNLLKVVEHQEGSVLEFQPGDSLLAAGRVAEPIYAYLRRDGEGGLVLETETSFRVYTPERPVVEDSAAAALAAQGE